MADQQAVRTHAEKAECLIFNDSGKPTPGMEPSAAVSGTAVPEGDPWPGGEIVGVRGRRVPDGTPWPGPGAFAVGFEAPAGSVPPRCKPERFGLTVRYVKCEEGDDDV